VTQLDNSLREQNRQLEEEVKRVTAEIQLRVEHIAAINRVAAKVGISLSLDDTLNTALQEVCNVTEAEASGLSLINEERTETILRAQLGWIHDFTSNPMRIPINKGMSGRVINNNEVVVHNNLTGDEDYAVSSFSSESFRSIAMAPMHARGQVIGILSVMSHEPDQFDKTFAVVLQAIADNVAVAVNNAVLYEKHVENEKQLSTILNSTADGIIATDSHSQITLVNHAAEEMLGIDAKILIGHNLRQVSLPRRIQDPLLLTLLPDAENTTFQITLENEQVLSFIVTQIDLERQVEQGAENDGWVIVLQDVTHIREAEIARARFIQAAAHDMRNPLSVTQSSIHLLDRLLDSQDENIREIIDMAYSGIDRLQSLIDDLLQIEKIESGYGFNLSETDVRALVREVTLSNQTLMEDKSIQLTSIVADDVPEIIFMDRDWVLRAINNFLDNARKYIDVGDAVSLGVYEKADFIHIEVSDTGPGIPASTHARLFERFYRVKESTAVKGSGLGLAITKSVAEAHGGTVYIRSNVGEGSIFGITLPLKVYLSDN
jgi:PAS domain S-box-containing protein